MKKDIVDLIKAQVNQACVMMPDIMTPPTIDLGKVTINEGEESIKLSTDQQQQLIDFLDKYKDSDRFLLEFKSLDGHYKLSMTRGSKKIEGPVNLSLYASNPVNQTLSEQVTIDIFVVTFLKTEEMQNVIFGVKTL